MKKVVTFKAVDEELDHLFSEATDFLTGNHFSSRDIILINTALEEVFVNIAHYAYQETGEAIVIFESDDDKIQITFQDHGVPFDPLEVKSPDITASSTERSIGGLGIYMVKKIMDDVKYEFIDKCNRLILIKKKPK